MGIQGRGGMKIVLLYLTVVPLKEICFDGMLDLFDRCFGFTDKGKSKASHQPVGMYGNGFKSGSMRLGRDALIFTKNGGCESVGMLSQTYLDTIKAQAVIVPIIPFNQQNKSVVVTEDSEASLAAILKYSLLASLEQLHGHFDSIPSKKGTKIVIWNMRRTKEGNPELDFDTDIHDIGIPEVHTEETKKAPSSSRSVRAERNLPEMRFSLRAYLSILYLKPTIQIVLRGEKVPAELVVDSLTHTEHYVYNPQFTKERVRVTFGLNLEDNDHCGIMMYHKNRLIKSYEKVGCQIKASGQRGGMEVMGVVECNFLKPHNKQDFEYTNDYRFELEVVDCILQMFSQSSSINYINKRRTIYPLIYSEKKPRLWEETQTVLECAAEVLHLGNEASEPQTASWEMCKQASTGRVEKLVDDVQKSSRFTSTQFLPSTQTMMASPLSQTGGQWSRPLPLEGVDRETMMPRLSGIEKEAQRLRKLLAMEGEKITQGMMTTDATSSAMETEMVAVAAKEFSYQTEVGHL
ncbi:MORC family CW-type zinc finger protein 4-like [Lampris incognitus]|uniref:MORC family CW-type zinc finger protein 4-like n=1 Tax=Lampris incognitus TaxID=2546036 RepID=UPI0024B5F839|nr:MORC family CW-type zinc finger protein 4-like [Lampris incognitus]